MTMTASGGRRGGGKSGGGGRGRGRGRGAACDRSGGNTSNSSAAGAAAATTTGDASQPHVRNAPPAGTGSAKGKHDAKGKRKGGNSSSASAANVSSANPRASGNARPPRTAHAVVRKIVIRKIPHAVAQDEVWALVAALGVPTDALWRFVPGKVRGNNREASTGRMYLDLKKDAELARQLIASLNGHALETKGAYVCV